MNGLGLTSPAAPPLITIQLSEHEAHLVWQLAKREAMSAEVEAWRAGWDCLADRVQHAANVYYGRRWARTALG